MAVESHDLVLREYPETGLVGNIRESETQHPNDRQEFLEDLQKLMLKHKVVKIDMAFDPFKITNL